MFSGTIKKKKKDRAASPVFVIGVSFAQFSVSSLSTGPHYTGNLFQIRGTASVFVSTILQLAGCFAGRSYVTEDFVTTHGTPWTTFLHTLSFLHSPCLPSLPGTMPSKEKRHRKHRFQDLVDLKIPLLCSMNSVVGFSLRAEALAASSSLPRYC